MLGCAVVLALSWTVCAAKVLTPPYINIAENSKVEATYTCGEEGPDLYCKLIGANQDATVDESNVIIHGQVCDVCDANEPSKSHPATAAVDGTESYWMSPPLSRGMTYSQVNFTIDLGQEFHVAYVILKMGISPRPEVWVLEKSSDNGATYSPWQYFADTLADCERFFGSASLEPITRDDSVICDTRNSKIIPLEDGEIVVSLLNDRPSANDFFNSSVLQEWTRATNVRLRLLQTKTLFAHYMSFARQDPSVTRRYFYSIRDINIGGRCRCNGHAEVCLPVEGTNKKVCDCKHNTTGDFCERCKENLIQKKWRQSKSNQVFECEECNCHGHSYKCIYNETVDALGLSLDKYGKYEGGGVCQDCEDFTEGINCERCKAGYYRPFGRLPTQKDACERCRCDGPYYTGNCADRTGICECKVNYQPPHCQSCALGYFGFPECKNCTCFIHGTEGGVCEPESPVSTCVCKQNFFGPECKICREGYHNFPECESCNCDPVGSSSEICNVTNGQCDCQNNFGSTKCDQCAHGYFDFPQCTLCKCDPRGTVEEICDKSSGQCLCKEGFGGDKCDKCIPGYKDYPDCQPCGCSEIGSTTTVCDVSGKCDCLDRFSGKTCTQCAFGYYKYPECLPCDCDTQGTYRNYMSCDDNAQCKCRPGIVGKRCDSCEEGLYNFPACEECDCDPAGVLPNSSDCGTLSKVGELCQCKSRVTGRKCKECKPLYWNLQYYNPLGCEECNCNADGIIGGVGVCDSKSGQCLCKENVESRGCDTCVDGSYNLQGDNLFGCTDCNCDIGGALDSNCNKETGACTCRPRIEGRSCNVPMRQHYFPTLYQFQYELEDGFTPGYPGDPVSFAYEESVFPGFSWRGYAVFSSTQNVIKYQVDINADTIHYVIMRYVNRNDETVVGIIRARHEDEDPLESKIYFKPSSQPAFAIATGAGKSTIPIPLVTTSQGKWDMEFIVNSTLFVDYFVLLPQSYFEGNVLIDYAVREPCKKGYKSLCKHYAYPRIEKYDTAYGNKAFLITQNGREPPSDLMEWNAHLAGSNVEDLPMLTPLQKELSFEVRTENKGPSFIIINYGTPEDGNATSSIKIEIEGDSTKYLGHLMLSPCPFTWLCRYAFLDNDGKIAVFNINDDFLTVTLELGNIGEVGIESVSVIPFDNKTAFDFLKPNPVCVIKDGICRSTLFTTPLDHHIKKVEFETGNEGRKASKFLPNTQDNNTGLIYLHKDDPMIDIGGKVSAPGNYTIIVHYYQPNNPDFNLEVLMHDLAPEGFVRLAHCPSTAGCRAVIKQNNGNEIIPITENYLFTFKVPNNKDVWLDYILILPESKFSLDYLIDKPEGSTNQFVTECTTNMYYVDQSASEFCRSAIFSLTTHFNNGALNCRCHPDGSYTLQCEPFGGQCKCKENIIGRRCQRCKTGYYQFPQCKQCSCPENSLCDEVTGQCSCPPNVVGENCDQCANNTYGYFPLLGCRECECNYLGLMDGNLQCDPTLGNCNCKENVIGRQCDSCKIGHYLFPECRRCDCELEGTTFEICSNVTGACLCKENVEDEACDICRFGSFNLQGSNKKGCTECFCFGHSQDCRSTRLYKSRIFSMNNWSLNTIFIKKPIIEYETLTKEPERPSGNSIAVSLIQEDLQNQFVFFSAPKEYLGNQLTSYGGHLSYQLVTTAGLAYEPAENAPTVILKGGGLNLLYYSYELPPSAGPFHVAVEIIESNFVLSTTFLQPTRPQLMQVLKDLEGIYIKATFWKNTTNSILENPLLDSASEVYSDLGLALSVEECLCEPQYTGLSCEECAPGYYRTNNGPYGGNCVPCQCHGHAASCDKQTGICIDCQHNTTGDHCEMCTEGYHGDARIGSPYDCLICACPLPIPSNNFAVSCELSPDGDSISCNCKKGYFGSLCDSCAIGYYGKPRQEGDGICRPCECSGNIDPNSPGSCDSITGECIKCLNNTYGEACHLCAPGFYGDAVFGKNCQSCVCDKCGTKSCDHKTGICECHENVQGEACDSCLENHYGLSSCQGCQSCNCGPASESPQCDLETGQCKCKPGVTGRACDRCDHGYWNYTSEGCKLCSCNIGYSIGVGCNPDTGKCECLPGVIGEKCDHCPPRWVLEKGKGCYSCDQCIDDLLDVMDVLHNKFDPFAREFTGFNESFFTRQRIVFINQNINELRPKVSELENVEGKFSPIKKNLDSIEDDVDKLKRTAEYIVDKTNNTMDKQLRTEFEDTEDLIDKAIGEAQLSVMEIKDIAESFSNGVGSKYFPSSGFADYLKEAQRILSDLQAYQPQHDGNSIRENNLARAEKLLQDVRKVKSPVDTRVGLISKLEEDIKSLNYKLADLKKHSLQSLEKAKILSEQTKKNREHNIPEKFKTIKNLEGNASNTLKAADELLEKTNELLSRVSNDLYRQFTNNKTEWEDFLSDSTKKIDALKSEIDELTELVLEATNHARELEHQGEELKNIEKEHEHDTNAVQGYKTIVNTLRDTLIIANDAKMTAERAYDESEGIGGKALESRDKSTSLYNDARETLSQSQLELEPELKGEKDKIESIQMKKGNIEGDIQELESNLNKTIDTLGQTNVNTGTELADEAVRGAEEVIENIKGIVDELPQKLDVSKEIQRNIKDSENDINGVNSAIDNILKILPDTKDLASKLKDRPRKMESDHNNLKDKLAELGRQIELARELANSVSTAVKFDRTSTLELRNPPGLPEQGVNNVLSLYFATQEANGLLFFIGNEAEKKKRSVNTGDFMVLEIENETPKLTVDLGDGATTLICDIKVSDEQWYFVKVERTGKSLTLSITRQKDGDMCVNSGVMKGSSTILNLDKTSSKFFIGGIPSYFKSPADVSYYSFVGTIEEVYFGESAIGLWNFQKAENIQATMERGIRKIGEAGCRFNGDGFISIGSQPYKLDTTTEIVLRFNTYASEGLLFLAPGLSSFISIELREGRILYQFDLGSGPLMLFTSKTFNDGKWHSIEVTRVDKKGNLKVDGLTDKDGYINTTEAPGDNTVFEPSGKLFIGGFPREHNILEVTEVDFDGCINNVQIDGTSVDLNIPEAIGTIQGCPPKFASIVSFEDGARGYALLPNISAQHDNLELILRFKTSFPNGLLAYADFGENSVSLSLNGGQIVFRVGESDTVMTEPMYNDSNWHVVMATFEIGSQLQLFIDDHESFSSLSPAKPIRMLHGNLYFGGVPSKVDAQAAISKHFSGCISDATLNGVIVNFGNLTEIPEAVIGKCIEGARKIPIHRPPPLPPPRGIKIPDSEIPITTIPAPVTTEKTFTLPPQIDNEIITTTPSTTSEVFRSDYSPNCKVPLYPTTSVEYSNFTVYHIGTMAGSRLEYFIQTKLRLKFDFSVDVKTGAKEGLIFYVSDHMHVDFVAVYISEGKVNFRFNCGSGAAHITSQVMISDKKWHRIRFQKQGILGTLTVDNDIVEGKSSGNAKTINNEATYYLGGLDPSPFLNSKDKLDKVLSNLKGINNSLDGCLKDFKFNNQLEKPRKKIGVTPCDTHYDSIYFHPEGGFVKLYDRFKMGRKFDITMEIKPRSLSGLLLAVHSADAYFVLEMENGEVKMTIDIGSGDITATYKPNDPYFLCDGNWHKITCAKAIHALILGVDGQFSEPKVGKQPVKLADTKHVLYLGGHPPNLSKNLKGIKSKPPFIGCIRNVIIKTRKERLDASNIYGNATGGVCPD
ncbi:unnamed protein product [Nezara viridula]|uniref:Laminin subunit alpha n=1 Tax=Nezara viridula TaxID=85310 RepID=A0A9P0GZJ8_NEZVI|nr:unnamed protein product [Nezara viridula]